MEVVVPPRFRHLHYRRRHRRCGRGPPRTWNSDKRLVECVPVGDLPIEIREVWEFNLEEEFAKIHWAVLHGYGVVAIDTEFPGAPYVPEGVSLDYRRRGCEDHYAVLKMNVERLKLIQVGITVTDKFGTLPHFGTGKRVAWEFNFSDFDADTDECNKESVVLLKSHGIDFERHKRFGINSARFACLMLRTGLVGPLGRSLAWITFQGGVDLAYLLKMVLGNGLPNELTHFKSCIKHFFGFCVFDVKHMMTGCQLYGGLDKVAGSLKVERAAGESHRAGSDSLLTTMVFQRLQELHFGQPVELYKCAGKLHNFV